MALYNWHNLVSKPFELLNALISNDTPLKEVGERLLHDELMELFGALAYTRCLVIYSIARVEKLGRGAASKSTTSVGGS
jgi:hypothetical protein